MKGAIAAGHPLTAQAGARVLEGGGNAVDACVAAAFAAFVAEGPLTGPAGGGFFLAHVEGEVTLLDCFFAVPTEPLGEIEHLTVDFGSSTQSYHVGDGSIAVPGLLAGLSEAHRRFGQLPWRELVAPAIELARAGVEVSEAQAFLHEILVGVLQRDEGGRRIYGTVAHLETADLAATLERVRDDPEAAVRELLPELESDLDAYSPTEREPLRSTIAGRDVLTTPPPSRGGAIVAAALAGFTTSSGLHERARALRSAYGSDSFGGITGTTHVSVIDAAGNAAGLSSTLGAGSGVHRGGTQLNNMLGEFDVIGSRGARSGRAAAEHDDADARARGRTPAARARKRGLGPARRRDRPGRRRGSRGRRGARRDHRAALPRRRRARAPPRGRLAGSRDRGAAAGRLGSDPVAEPEPLLRRRGGGRAPC